MKDNATGTTYSDPSSPNIDTNIYIFDDTKEQFKFSHKGVESVPSFIQTPGKDWNCYNALIDKLKYCNTPKKCYYYEAVLGSSGEVTGTKMTIKN